MWTEVEEVGRPSLPKHKLDLASSPVTVESIPLPTETTTRTVIMHNSPTPKESSGSRSETGGSGGKEAGGGGEAGEKEKNTTTTSSSSGGEVNSHSLALNGPADAAIADVITETGEGSGALEKREVGAAKKGRKSKRKELRLSSVTDETGADGERQRRIAALGPEKLGQLQRKRKDLEAAYKQDCETFATVVKMLINKEPSLEDKLLPSMRDSLKDIGSKFITELNAFVDELVAPAQEAA